MREKTSPLGTTAILVSFLEFDSREETSKTGACVAVGAESARATLTDSNIDEKNKCVMIPQTSPSATTRKIKSHRNRFFTVPSFRFVKCASDKLLTIVSDLSDFQKSSMGALLYHTIRLLSSLPRGHRVDVSE